MSVPDNYQSVRSKDRDRYRNYKYLISGRSSAQYKDTDAEAKDQRARLVNNINSGRMQQREGSPLRVRSRERQEVLNPEGTQALKFRRKFNRQGSQYNPSYHNIKDGRMEDKLNGPPKQKANPK